MEAANFASFSVFCKLPKPQVIVIHVKKLKVSFTMAWTILYINVTGKQFGIAVLVILEVALKANKHKL